MLNLNYLIENKEHLLKKLNPCYFLTIHEIIPMDKI